MPSFTKDSKEMTATETIESTRLYHPPDSVPKMVIDIPAKIIGNNSKPIIDVDETATALFSLDEEQPSYYETPKRYNEETHSDVEEGQDGEAVDGNMAKLGLHYTGELAYGTSLPVTIPAGRFWPPNDAVDSIEEKDILSGSFDENSENRAKTVLPQRAHKDLFHEMRAQARSVQAADDPERLFGERPPRRRYRTGEEDVHTPQVLPQNENAIVIVAANVLRDV